MISTQLQENADLKLHYEKHDIPHLTSFDHNGNIAFIVRQDDPRITTHDAKRECLFEYWKLRIKHFLKGK